MAEKTIFKRHELKYMLDIEQYQKLVIAMDGKMKLDKYGRNRITSIYYDTDDYKIIRNSIEKPKYREKLRARVYGKLDDNANAFIELKKKYNGIVYKRRIIAKQSELIKHLNDNVEMIERSQIQREIDYFKSRYEKISAKVYLAYDREAYYSDEDSEFRMTFDFNIKMRNKEISFTESEDDLEILPSNKVMLEVKTVTGMPFWLLEFFQENKIQTVSFSKYGTGFKKYIIPKFIERTRIG